MNLIDEFDIIILHDFNGRPYYKSLEANKRILYVNTRPFRFLLRDLLKFKKLSLDSINSIKFLILLPLIKNKKIILAMAPLNWRVVLYSLLLRKNVLTYHSSWPFWQADTPFSYSFFNRCLRKIWINKILSFDNIVVVTQSSKKSLCEFSGRMDINQIYHTVDCQKITEQEFYTKWARPGNYNIGFLGRLEESKGLKDIIVFSKTTMNQVMVAGTGSLEADVAAADKSGYLKYCGNLTSRKDVREYLKGLHILLLPSRKSANWEELFGIVIIEAMSQGVVVITTDHVGPREIITNCVNGIILTEDDFLRGLDNAVNYERSKLFNIAERALIKSKEFEIDVIYDKWRVSLEL
jgi:glycosyltransferase involved in cell wall biosynthesis